MFVVVLFVPLLCVYMRDMGVDPFLSGLYGVPHDQPMTECLERRGEERRGEERRGEKGGRERREGRKGKGKRGTLTELFGHTRPMLSKVIPHSEQEEVRSDAV